MEFEQGALLSAATFTMTEYSSLSDAQEAFHGQQNDDDSRKKRQSADYDYSTDAPGNVESSYVVVQSDSDGEMLTPDTGMTVTISLKLDGSADPNTKVYVSNRNTQGNFRELSTRVEDGMAIADTDEEGVYVAASPAIAVYITVGTVLFVLIVVALAIVGVVIYFRVRREKWHRVKDSVTGLSRSFQKKI